VKKEIFNTLSNEFMERNNFNLDELLEIYDCWEESEFDHLVPMTENIENGVMHWNEGIGVVFCNNKQALFFYEGDSKVIETNSIQSISKVELIALAILSYNESKVDPVPTIEVLKFETNSLLDFIKQD
jgi:hypothetical protein